MNSGLQASAYFVSWDVGGWNCDKNGESRDAIVILDDSLVKVGQPWCGNLRASINAANTRKGWIHALFALCSSVPPPSGAPIFMAIDTPLGFS